jgi:ABC transporter substrate binding protein
VSSGESRKKHEETNQRVCALRHALCALHIRRRAAGRESRPHRLPGWRHCFRYSGGSFERVPPRANQLGWIEGKNITIEYRFAEHKFARLPELAAELVRQKIDLIVVNSVAAASAAKSATTTIPIVMAAGSDPVAAGLIASLARPGGNVTGLSGLASELNTKRLEILKDAVPKLVRVGLLRQPGGSMGFDLQLKEIRAAAPAPIPGRNIHRF